MLFSLQMGQRHLRSCLGKSLEGEISTVTRATPAQLIHYSQACDGHVGEWDGVCVCMCTGV